MAHCFTRNYNHKRKPNAKDPESKDEIYYPEQPTQSLYQGDRAEEVLQCLSQGR